MRAAVDGGACRIVDFGEAGAMKRRKVDEWLGRKVAELYGRDGCEDNETLRLMTLYELLEGEARNEFYGYVRAAASKAGGERLRREQFWAWMTAVPSEWEDMERYGKELLCMQKLPERKVTGV